MVKGGQGHSPESLKASAIVFVICIAGIFVCLGAQVIWTLGKYLWLWVAG
jgi:hypothetical protein